ncbi:thiamine pyrophosphate-dependent acetolactate synthase large subunit-like protein [Leucobacter exalbidus]|uniref:Thiamine pyrophosphate-dependent acetolactate synthase large subunit-like protein n=1 Tax=Leucobacter exalbidus TaxID=662960 RepID=A0A940T445_9MICO|nr:5-guanidino-2-oxopentanoate decarboxylase [Leucobacter exalbidus]MBP1326493.1 thiamine pyrophosphate-dependent acetolactate synthase large subunit-like protein [Leucobacter exalbidus]
MMRFGEAICAVLSSKGVDTVFGIPGVHTLELFRGLKRNGITAVVPRHEQGAGFMADGFARTSGRAGVCFLVTGPGVLNALTAIAQAWHDSIPMLIVASTVESSQVGKHRGTLHDTPDIADTLRPYTLFSKNISSIAEFSDSVDEMYDRWRTERPRPVYIGVPLDVLAELVELPSRADTTPEALPEVDTQEMERVAALLATADAPVIVAGGGCRNAGALLADVAERLDAPVVLTTNSKGLLSDHNPLNVNVSTPFEGTQQLLQDADLVLAIGTELSDFEYIATGSTPVRLNNIIRVDIDPSASHQDQETPTICADAAEFLQRLRALLTATPRSLRAARGVDRAAAARRSWTSAYTSDPYYEWVEAFRKGLPDDAIIAVDSAQLAYQAHQFMELPSGATWLSPYGYGTLGPALPMAVGAAIAQPERPVIAVAGDGSSLFTIAELATAVDLNRQLTVVIWINGGYREIEASFDRVEIEPVGVATSAPDFTALTAGLGATPVQVQSPGQLTEALREAAASPRLTVILVEAPEGLRITSES